MKYVTHQFLFYGALLFVGVASLVLFPTDTFAARIFYADVPRVGVDQTFEMSIWVDTEGELINAVEGTALFPPEFTIKSVRSGDSVVPFWVNEPKANNNSVFFSGIIPSGLRSSSGKVFSVILVSSEETTTQASFKDVRVLLHDGLGTEATTTARPTAVVSRAGEKPVPFVDVAETDIVSPEPFVPLVGQSNDIFDGEPFVTFSTQDKGSGVEGYFLIASKNPLENFDAQVWKKVTSPHVLSKQEQKSFLYIKAVDYAGNERVAVVAPVVEGRRVHSVPLGVFILLGIMTLIGITFFVRRRS